MRTLIIYPIDPEPSPTEVRACMLNAQQQEGIVPSELLLTVPFTRRGAILGWAQLRGIGWMDLPGPTKPSRSARLIYHQRAIAECDALVLMRRSQIPSTHSDLLLRAVRERKHLFVWFLTDAPHCRPLVLRSEEHTSELQSHHDLVCRLLLEKKKKLAAAGRELHGAFVDPGRPVGDLADARADLGCLCSELRCAGGVFFFNDTATTEIYTLSLHDALPIYQKPPTCIGSQIPSKRRFSKFVNI